MKSKGLNIIQSMAKGAWMDELPQALKDSVFSLYGYRVIFNIRRAVLPHAFQVAATVFTRDRGDCDVFVEATGFNLLHIHTECSCPVKRNCKHAYAALLAGSSRFYNPREDLPPDPSFKIFEKPLRVPLAAKVNEAAALPPGIPQPVLRLVCEYPFSSYLGWFSGVSYGDPVRLMLLSFKYDEAPDVMFPHGGGEPRAETWRRDLEQEREYAATLEAFGFRRCSEVLLAGVKAELRDALCAAGSVSDAMPWAPFLLYHAPQLKKSGWIVETDASFDLHIVEPQYFYEDIRETDRPDWFSADIGVEVDGKRVPLLPLIVRYLANTPGGLDPGRLAGLGDQPVLIPMDNGRTQVPIPASRLYRILTNLTELLTAGEKALEGDRLPMHRLRAAAYASAAEEEALCQRTSERLKDLAASLRAGKFTVDRNPPVSLQADLRPYQIEGWRWLQFLAQHGIGGILADDMGLGKTVQTLAHLLAERESGTVTKPSLIVCPTSLLSNWRDEAARFCPSLRTRVHYGSGRAEALKNLAQCDLLITSYPLLGRDEEALTGIEFHAVVLDEAQYIKNPRTLAAKAACRLQSSLRLCLSGTPMENHLGELWSLFRFLMPGFLGTADQFNTTFRTPIEKEQNAERRLTLTRRVAPVLLRRTKQAVLTELPPKVEMVQRTALTPAQADLYESVRAAMDKQVHAEIDRSGIERSRIYILDALLKLRQVCCHPKLLKTEQAAKVDDSAKLDALMDLVEPLVEEGRRILVFSQFVEMLRLISKRLKGEKIVHLMLTGETKSRGEMVKEFQAGSVPVFLISLKAGGTGLNLTAADTVIHYDPWWNPAVETQATDRAHRIGQQSTVFVHKLICEGTIEERILALQKRKAALVAGLLEGSGSLAGLNEEDIEFLLAPLK